MAFLTACSKENSQTTTPFSDLPVITFQEIYPENQGQIAPQNIKLTKWYWERGLKPGDTMLQGLHYKLEGIVPTGLQFEIIIIDNQTAQARFKGSASDHHVSKSIDDLRLSLQKEAFLGSPQEVFDIELTDFRVAIQYGKGYQLSGTAQNLPENIHIRLLRDDTVHLLTPHQNDFSFDFPFEPGEEYEVLVEDHPQGTCCTMTNGYGSMPDHDVDNINITCTKPEWQDPTSSDDDFSAGGGLFSQQQLSAYDNSTDTLELLSLDGRLISHISYKPQHNHFVKPDVIDIQDPRVLFESINYPNKLISNFTFDTSDSGASILLIEEEDGSSNTKEIYVSTYTNFFRTETSSSTLLMPINYQTWNFKVYAYGKNKALVIYFNDQNSQLSYAHFDGTSWRAFQKFGDIQNNNIELVAFKGDINQNGYGVFALKYRYIHSDPNASHTYKVYRTEYSQDTFSHPERISVGMYKMHQIVLPGFINENLVTTEGICQPSSACDCDNALQQPDPICYINTPIHPSQLFWHRDFFFLYFPDEYKSIFVEVDQDDQATIFWYQSPYQNAPQGHYLMMSERKNSRWHDPETINDKVFIVQTPQGGELVSDQQNNAALFIHSTDSNLVDNLNVFTKTQGHWNLNHNMLVSQNPLGNTLSLGGIRHSSIYSIYDMQEGHIDAAVVLERNGRLSLEHTSKPANSTQWTPLRVAANNNFSTSSLDTLITKDGAASLFWNTGAGNNITTHRIYRSTLSSQPLFLPINIPGFSGNLRKTSKHRISSCGNGLTFFHGQTNSGFKLYASRYN